MIQRFINDRRNRIFQVITLTPKLCYISIRIQALLFVYFQRLIKLFNKLTIFDQISWIIMNILIIEVHQTLKIYQKFILISHNLREAARLQPGQSTDPFNIIKDHNYYLMIVRQVIKRNFNLNSLVQFSFSNPFFSKAQSPAEVKQKAETRYERSASDRLVKEDSKQNLQVLVNKINEANKFFLGVKLNTNYLKVNKVVKYQEVSKLTTAKATVNELPIQIGKKQAEQELFDKVNQQSALEQKSGQIVFSRARLEPTIEQMQKIIQKFIVSIGTKTRMVSVQPNFQIQCIKTLNSLDPKLQINLQNGDANPDIKIKSITLLKGLTAYRNDNYSTDSFEKNEQEVADGIIAYKLYRQPKEEYPQFEWFTTKRINARFEVLVRGGPALTVLESGNKIGSTANVIHSVVIEADLVPPPPNAQQQLSAEQFLRSYRLDYKSMLITNFDRKNQFYGLTYTENEKKGGLVNRII